jgi:hypothetical protein
MEPKKLLAAIAVAATTTLLPGIAGSEEETTCPEGMPRGTICLGVTEILGHVHRPSAVYVLDRTRLVHRRSALEESFTAEVIDSVDGDPF